MKPLGNNLIVEPFVPQHIGAIYLPPALLDSVNVGGVKLFKVLSVGPGRLTKKGVRIPIEIEPGQRIVTHSYTEGPKALDGRAVVINADTVLAVIPDL